MGDRDKTVNGTYTINCERFVVNTDFDNAISFNGLNPSPIIYDEVFEGIVTNDTVQPATNKQIIFSNTLNPATNAGITITAGSGTVTLTKIGTYVFTWMFNFSENCQMTASFDVNGLSPQGGQNSAIKIGAQPTAPFTVSLVHGQGTTTPTNIRFFLFGDSQPVAGTPMPYVDSNIFIRFNGHEYVPGA